MDRKYLFHRLDLNDDRFRNEKVHSKTRVQPLTLADNGEFNLPQERNVTACEFLCQAYFIRGFEQARPQVPVNLNRRPDDDFCFLAVQK